jgi:hypothetical protein
MDGDSDRELSEQVGDEEDHTRHKPNQGRSEQQGHTHAGRTEEEQGEHENPRCHWQVSGLAAAQAGKEDNAAAPHDQGAVKRKE